MKMLVHRVAPSVNIPFSLAALKTYLRVNHNVEDALISEMGMAAAGEIEHFAQIALLTQTVRVTIFKPALGECGLSLPIGPVPDSAVITVTVDGAPFTAFDFVTGPRPYIQWLAKWHDLRPSRVSIEYQAGFGETSGNIPSDLMLAIMDQVALHYEGRAPMDEKALTTSPHMARIGARYRGVSL